MGIRVPFVFRLFPFIYCLLLLFLIGSDRYAMYSDDAEWIEVAEGLHYGLFSPPTQSPGTSKITILRIDAEAYEFRLLCQSEHPGNARTVRQWADEFGLVAAINAGMFQEDGQTSVGYLRNHGHINNPAINRNQAIFTFAPRDTSRQQAFILDRECDSLAAAREDYQCMLQSIRMISCDQRNVWSAQPQMWQIAALARDKSGNILFIISESRHSVHDFINILLEMPVRIHNAMYLEGGPAASFYFDFDRLQDRKKPQAAAITPASQNIGGTRIVPNILGILPRH